MYKCNLCNKEVKVDHINPPIFSCECENRKVITSLQGWLSGESSFGEQKSNNNLSEASAIILKNSLFAISANEFFVNKKNLVEAIDIRIKDSNTGREFSFTLIGNEI